MQVGGHQRPENKAKKYSSQKLAKSPGSGQKHCRPGRDMWKWVCMRVKWWGYSYNSLANHHCSCFTCACDNVYVHALPVFVASCACTNIPAIHAQMCYQLNLQSSSLTQSNQDPLCAAAAYHFCQLLNGNRSTLKNRTAGCWWNNSNCPKPSKVNLMWRKESIY